MIADDCELTIVKKQSKNGKSKVLKLAHNGVIIPNQTKLKYVSGNNSSYDRVTVTFQMIPKNEAFDCDSKKKPEMSIEDMFDIPFEELRAFVNGFRKKSD